MDEVSKRSSPTMVATGIELTIKAFTLMGVVCCFFVGLHLCNALHECGHAVITLMLGGGVEWIRFFGSAAGPPAIMINGLLPGEHAIVASAGVVFAGWGGALVTTMLPWGKMNETLSLVAASMLLPFALNAMPLIFAPYARQGDAGQLNQFIPPVALGVVALLWCGGCVWFWWRQSKITSLVSRTLRCRKPN